MDELDSDESKLLNYLDKFNTTLKNGSSYPSVHKLIYQREIFGQRLKNRTQKLLEVISEKKIITKTHDQISCQLGSLTKSTFLMVFSSNGKIVASTHGDHNIYVTNIKNGDCLHTLKGHPRTPWCIAFHPSSNDLIASGCLGGEVRVWDLKGSCEVWISPRKNEIASLSFHPNDSVLAIATDNQIFFWNWTLKDPFTSISTKLEKEKVKYVKFDPLGYKLITGIANIRTEVKEGSCASSSSWRHPSSANLFGTESNASSDTRGLNASGIERRSRPYGMNNSLIGRDVMLSDANSDDSIRLEETRHSNRPSDESSSSSSSSLDSSSSMTSGISRFSEWNTRLSLLWASRRNQTENESDNSAGSLAGEDNEDINTNRNIYNISNTISDYQNNPTECDTLNSDSSYLDSHASFRFMEVIPANAVPATESCTSTSNRNCRRVSSRSARSSRRTGFHSPPRLGPGGNWANFYRNSSLADRNNYPSSLVSASTREIQSDELDPLQGISLLSGHIENMQRICGSLELERRTHSNMENEHREISRLGQIRSMLIDIQNEIQSLRSAVNQTGEPSTGRISPIEQRSQSAVQHLNNYTINPNTRANSTGESSLSTANTRLHYNQRPENGDRNNTGETRPLERHSTRGIQCTRDEVRRIRQRRVERENIRAVGNHLDRDNSNGPSYSFFSSGEFRRRLNLPRRLEFRSSPYSRYPEYCGERNYRSNDYRQNAVADCNEDNEPRYEMSATTPRTRRTFSLNYETGHVPPDRSIPDQRPNRFLDWQRFDRFRRLRNCRRTETPSTSLSSRISMMLQEQESTFNFLEPAEEEHINLNSAQDVSQPGPSNVTRERSHLEQQSRLTSFRIVMHRLLEFVNELGTEVMNSRFLTQTSPEETHGPSNEIDLEASRIRNSFREAYRLTLRSLILRIYNFIDNYQTDNGFEASTLNNRSGIDEIEDLIPRFDFHRQRDQQSRNLDEHSNNIRLLTRLALLLIYQLINVVSTPNILDEERPISRLPNPLRNIEDDTSHSMSNQPEGETLSDLALDLSSILEFVDLTCNNLHADTNRSSPSISNDEDSGASMLNTITTANNIPAINSGRLSSVPRPQRIDCRRLSRARVRARNLLNLSHLPSSVDRAAAHNRSERTDSERSLTAESSSVIPEIILNETVDMNSNYVNDASSSQQSSDLLPLSQNEDMDFHLRTFGGVPLRILCRQNAFDGEERPTLNEGVSLRRSFISRRSSHRQVTNSNNEAVTDANRRVLPADQLFFYRPITSNALFNDGEAAAQRDENVPTRCLFITPRLAQRHRRMNMNVETESVTGSSRRNRQSDQFMFYRPSSINLLPNSNNSSGYYDLMDSQLRPAGVNSIVNIGPQIVSHRLQIWEFNITNLPDIGDRKKNVIVRKCKIHFDASVELSSDGSMLIALINKEVEYSSVVICSLLQANLGEVLFCHTVEPNSICVSLSPTMMHLVVGVGSFNNRLGIFQKQVVAFIYKLNKEKRALCIQRGIELRTDHRLISLNCIKWIPYPGAGFIYGTNRGQLTILH